jgi:phosphoglycerate dehydrogenase-like enzyme
MQDDAFQVGVTRDLVRSDGSLVFAPIGLETLDRPGFARRFLDENRPQLTSDDLAGLDALFHFSPAVVAASLEGVERLALIARHGVGLDFLDLDACTERGIAVTITPAGITRAMASAAVAFVLALSHRLLERHSRLVEGRWSEGRFDIMGLGLTGRTLGVIGYGRIGREVVRLLRPWELRVLVAQRSDPRDPDVEHVPLDSLLEEADVVVVACPLTPETHHLLDAQRLALLKSGALLVNVARGPIVDQKALAEALYEGRLGGAGLDVFEREPVDPDDPILRAPGFVGAPHSLGYWDELFRRCVADACSAIVDVAAGRVPRDVANADVQIAPVP